VATAGADVSDLGENDLTSLGIKLGGLLDGASEIVSIGGADFVLNIDRSQTVTVGGTSFAVNYTVAAGFIVTQAAGGLIPRTDMATLVRGIGYRNARMATLTYQGNLAFNGADTLTVLSIDSDGTPLSDTDTVAITVTSINDAPVNTVPGAQTVDEDTPLALSGISVNDVDGNLATTQLSVTSGVLTVDLTGGATVSAGTNGSATLTLSGTQAQINAALATLTYQGSIAFNGSDNGADTLTVISTDSDGTPLSDTDTVAIGARVRTSEKRRTDVSLAWPSLTVMAIGGTEPA
jgi:hypothetical protein